MKKVLLLAGVITLAGCQPKLEECWSDSTKANIQSLVRKSLLEKIETVADAERQSPSNDENRAFYDSALTVIIDTYHAVNRNSEAGSLSCGANVGMKYKTKDGKTLESKNASISFVIYKAENGTVFSIENTMPLASLITTAK